MKGLLLTLLFPILLSAQVREVLIDNGWKFRKKGDQEWMKAVVPGTVHTDLLANKKIPDPYVGTNEKELQWIENEEWEYETTLYLSDLYTGRKKYELIFEGLDTYATVYFNDSLILEADNMFRTWTIDVTKLIKFPDNKIKVHFGSAVKKGKELADRLPYTLPEGERVFTRKAQYQYGWDFAPRFVTCGIGKSVKLRMWSEALLEDIYVQVDSLNEKKAVLNFNLNVNCISPGDYQIKITSTDVEGRASEFNTPMQPGVLSYDLPFIIETPKLWWCNGLGVPNLYNFTVKLLKGKEVLAVKEVKTGLRKIELIQQKDQWGQSFYFKLNGKPVFMKGANLVPPAVFMPNVTKQKYATMVQDAEEANMNMLRVWGGGVYLDDEFYEQCDAKGILVWQDLMFACAMYPGKTQFIESVGTEISEQIKRLRNYACLALWCGNNESDEGWKNWGWQKQYKYSYNDSARIADDYVFFFEHLVLDLVRVYDPARKYNYIPSSPLYGWGRKESMASGDSHYWGVWWGMEPFEVYNNKVGRFMSEYGFQSMPAVGTLSMTCSDSLSLGSDCIKNKQKHLKGFETIREYMQRDYKVPVNFDDYVYVSQLLQARGMEIAIEAHRRAKPYCMGSLYWQFNDCWPGISWSSIDHFGNKKAAWYAAKRSFSKDIISTTEEDDSVKICIVSDGQTQRPATLTCELLSYDGQLLWSGHRELIITPNSSKVYFSFQKKEIEGFNMREVVLHSFLVEQPDKIPLSSGLHYFVRPKELNLRKPQFLIEWKEKNTFEISSTTLAKDVFLETNTEGVGFDDNFFDLLPGERKKIKLSGVKKGEAPTLKVKSLYDTN